MQDTQKICTAGLQSSLLAQDLAAIKSESCSDDKKCYDDMAGKESVINSC